MSETSLNLTGPFAFHAVMVCPLCGGKVVTGGVHRTRCCNEPYTSGHCLKCGAVFDGDPHSDGDGCDCCRQGQGG